jgi:hypothetical protein
LAIDVIAGSGKAGGTESCVDLDIGSSVAGSGEACGGSASIFIKDRTGGSSRSGGGVKLGYGYGSGRGRNGDWVGASLATLTTSGSERSDAVRVPSSLPPS